MRVRTKTGGGKRGAAKPAPRSEAGLKTIAKTKAKSTKTNNRSSGAAAIMALPRQRALPASLAAVAAAAMLAGQIMPGPTSMDVDVADTPDTPMPSLDDIMSHMPNAGDTRYLFRAWFWRSNGICADVVATIGSKSTRRAAGRDREQPKPHDQVMPRRTVRSCTSGG